MYRALELGDESGNGDVELEDRRRDTVMVVELPAVRAGFVAARRNR